MMENNELPTGDAYPPIPDMPTIFNNEGETENEIEEQTDKREQETSENAKEGIERLLTFFDQFPGPRGIEFAPKTNIADMFDSNKLRNIGQSCIDGFDADKATMSEWSKWVKEGIELNKQAEEARSGGDAPWDGAANYKTPLALIAALKYSDRAVIEILRSQDLVKPSIIGQSNDEKRNAGKRTSYYMNWQLNWEMPEWRPEHEKLIYSIPLVGCMFKKTYYDPSVGRPTSKLIRYPDFVVDNCIDSLERLRRFSVIFDLTANEIESRKRRGVWLDINLQHGVDADDISAGNTYGQEYSAQEAEQDKYTTYIEQEGYYDLDGDGFEEPHMFVIHKNEQMPVRIMPNFEVKDVRIRLKDGKETNLLEAINKNYELKDAIIIKIKKQETLTKYDFLHDPETGFLGVGFPHILGGYCNGINTLINQLIDAGTLSNLPAGFLAKGFRKKMGALELRPGEFNQTGLSAQEMKDGVMLLPFKEPSQVLFSLTQYMQQQAETLSASADLKGVISAQAPATTTLAMLVDQQEASGAITWRIHTAMTQEFRKLFAINSKFTDPEQYKQITNNPDADFMADFDERLLTVLPTASPDMSSKMQRLQQAEAAVSQVLNVAQTGGNVKPIWKMYFTTIGLEDLAEEVFPELGPMEQVMEIMQKNPDVSAQIMGEKENLKRLTDEQVKFLKQQQDDQSTLVNAEIAAKEKDAELKETQAQKALAEIVRILSQASRETALAQRDATGVIPNYVDLMGSPALQPEQENLPRPNLNTQDELPAIPQQIPPQSQGDMTNAN